MSTGAIIPVNRYGVEQLPGPGAAATVDMLRNFGAVSGYEGAQWSGVRSGFFNFPLDGKKELGPYTRVQLLRKKRALEANLPIIGRIQGAVGRKSVGRGCVPKPRTTDLAWNKENRRQFLNRASNPSVWSVDGSMDFFEQTRFLVESRFGDGEGFAIFSKAQGGALQVDIRDCAECSGDDEEAGFHDGVKSNAAGRPLAYRFQVFNTTGDVKPYDVPASAVCHLRRVRRARSVRAITEFYAGINSFIDVLDLKALLIGTAKLHSAIGVKVKGKKGDAGKTGLTNNLKAFMGQAAEGTKVGEGFMGGAAIAWLAENEDLELVSSEHPGPNMLEFIRFLLQDCTVGTDIPFSIIWSMAGMGGAPSRMELDDAQDFFNAEQDRVVWRFCQRAYILDTAIRMDLGLIAPPSDPEWWKCDWRGPAKITADKRNQSKSDIDRLHNLMLTWGQYWDEAGLDGEEVEDERIEEISRVMDKCEKARNGKGIPFELLMAPVQGVAAPPPKPGEDDESKRRKEAGEEFEEVDD